MYSGAAAPICEDGKLWVYKSLQEQCVCVSVSAVISQCLVAIGSLVNLKLNIAGVERDLKSGATGLRL